MIGYPGTRVMVSSNLQQIGKKPEPSGKSAYDYSMFSREKI